MLSSCVGLRAICTHHAKASLARFAALIKDAVPHLPHYGTRPRFPLNIALLLADSRSVRRTARGTLHGARRLWTSGPHGVRWGYDSRWPATQLARELDDQVAQARRIRPHSGCAPPLTVSKTRGTSISAPGCALLCVRAERAVRIPGLPYRRGRRRRRAVGAGERGGAAESGCAFAFAVCGAGKRGESI